MRLIAIALGLLMLALAFFYARRRRGAAQPVATAPPADEYAQALSHYDVGRSVEAEAGLRRVIAARPDFPEAYFKLGNVLADLGRLDEAEAAYRNAVRLQPDFQQVHNNLGNLLRFNGALDEAEASFRRAIASKPDFAEAHSNLGILLVEAGRAEAAEAAFREALRASPASYDTLFNFAQLLNDTGRLDEAESAYRQALRIKRDFSPASKGLAGLLVKTGRIQESLTYLRDIARLHPDDLDAHIRLGLALAECGQSGEAEEVIRLALDIQPDNSDALFCLANVLVATDRLEEGEAAFRLALAAKPDDTDVLNNFGNLLAKMGRFPEAEAVYRQALAIKPDDIGYLNNLGNLLWQALRFDEAEAVYRRALALQPDKLDTLNNLGTFLVFIGRTREAEAVYRQSVGIKPDQCDIRYNLAHLYLLEGNFAQGWEEMEHRWHVKEQHVLRGFTQPRWHGLAYPGQTLLVHHEQGFGDSIQLLRYLPKVAALGGRLIFECQAPLYRLFRETLPAEIELARFSESLPGFDIYCPLMSLPLHFQTRLDTIPAEVPYLKIPAEALANSPLLQANPGAPLKVGLVWAGSVTHQNDKNRSLDFALLEPLFAVPGVTWVILQMERRPEGFAQRVEDRGWLDPMGGVKDFADTAAIIDQLDLVIGVDTSVIHLAGALAKPVWLLLPQRPDWRWLLDRDDNPWYPGMRSFRQLDYNSWPALVRRVADTLASERDALLQPPSALS
jgi:Flp pilus assembly protein TadD